MTVTDPDPLRDAFVRGARILLDRAYAHPGQWQGTRLDNPDDTALIALARLGIRWNAPDNVSAVGGRRGGLNARTRWARAFVRCLYHQHLYYAATQTAPGWVAEKRMVRLRTRALDIEVGRALPGSRINGAFPGAGARLLPGRAVRIRVRRSTPHYAEQAARRLPGQDRIWTDDTAPGARFSDPALRDWV